MHKGDYFINRQTGQRVRIVETQVVLRGEGKLRRYRLSDSNAFLDERQVRALYDRVAQEPVRVGEKSA